ncbi:glycosyltransferase family 2 protein [Alicyclobacillus tolerans]|uniref:Glycosyltransferase, GT2 family n=1 Tax=Alicyclobacillus tolerans TaxID=90970 RepID=A0A1M6N1A1_9BACL|nr:glycosyltransferase [Alicyclobacillus montanus]SHJ89413.1 Glycosyltransferase, GT2 family [Alicyclobacillus montanus]
MNNISENDMKNFIVALQNLNIPELRTDVTSWHGHMPFAFFLIAAIKPKLFVELGTHKGDSYCSFCQAVKLYNINTQCYAVDTWKGDIHAGFYEENIYNELLKYNNERYGDFSTLIRTTFDEAKNYFENNTIDLLHIDGLHTYEAVKNDFLNWYPKLSEKAVVIFHDTQVKDSSFGVWKFWEEIKNHYPNFEIKISNGLGLIAVGKEIPSGIKPILFDKNSSELMTNIITYAGKLILENDLNIKLLNELHAFLDIENLNIENLSSYFMKLYWGKDDLEFSEQISQEVSLRKIIINKENLKINFKIQNEYFKVRIDPVNAPAIIGDFKIFLYKKEALMKPIELNLLDLQCNNILIKDNKLICLNNDPQIIIKNININDYDELCVQFGSIKIINQEFADIIEDFNSDLTRMNESGDILINQLNQMEIEINKLKSFIKDKENELQILSEKNKIIKEENHKIKEKIKFLDESLNSIINTKGWKMLNFLRVIRNYIKHPFFYLNKIFLSIKRFGIRQTMHRIYNKTITELNSNIVSYDHWQKNNEIEFLNKKNQIEAEISSWKEKPLISVVMPTFNTKVEWLNDAVNSLLIQPYSNWELIISDDNSSDRNTVNKLSELSKVDSRIKVFINKKNSGISQNTNIAISNACGKLITFLDHDDTLAPYALYEVAKKWNETHFDILYSDEDKIGEKGYEDAFFKPDYSADYLLSCNYINHITVYKRDLLDKVGNLNSEYDGVQDYDLLLRMTEVSNIIVHVPKILYHWRRVPGSTASSFDSKSYAQEAGKKAIQAALIRRGEDAIVLDTIIPGHYRVERRIVEEPLVSIIIPIRDNFELLKNCLDSIKKSSYKNIEILIVDNGSKDKNTLEYLESLREYKILRYDIPFNYSKLNNLAVKESTGAYLLFLNNDIEVISEDWIEQMLQHAQRKEVGVVGAKLYYPNNKVQHAGVILGIGGIAGHSHKFSNKYSSGYFSMLVDIRNYSAVTAACMMVPRNVFEKVGGFNDEYLAVAFNDVDLCLRIREAGYLCVFTPYAELMHYESLSRGKNVNYNEVFYMQKKWDHIIKKDPYYNINLSLLYEDFRFDASRSTKFVPSLKKLMEIAENVIDYNRTNNEKGKLKNAVDRIIEIMYSRPDLLKEFYEKNEELDMAGLINWALEIGIKYDSSKELLVEFQNDYKHIQNILN